MGSFAGLTAKGWVLMNGTHQPMLLALHFALLSLPTLVVSGPAGVVTDRHGCERVLVWAQWGLLLGAALGALAIPLSHGQTQAGLLLLSTLVVGLASAYELTARNKYCALLVNRPEELGPYLTSFSVVFNVGKLVGPPIGGALVAFTGPAMALLLDATTYLLPIASVVWLLRPHREQEQRSQGGASASLGAAWRNCGPDLRHVLRFTGLFCLVGFFHPGLAPLIAAHLVGPSPQDLGLFTSILAAGSIVAEGPPDQLGGSERSVTRIDFTLPTDTGGSVPEPEDLPEKVLAARVEREPGEADGRRIHLRTDDATSVLAALTGWAVERGIELESLEAVRPSLEDVYLELTGAGSAAHPQEESQPEKKSRRGRRGKR
jgi:hypothetical protein